jgi:multidrug transporter EmrE-like cation transporter
VTPAAPVMLSASSPAAWLWILSVAALAIAGEVLIATGMKKVGDLDEVLSVSGLGGAISVVLSSGALRAGAVCMALNFFAMLGMVSAVELSLGVPATASLTYVGNAVAAKLFLKEAVDHRRWLATSFVLLGVVLLRH